MRDRPRERPVLQGFCVSRRRQRSWQHCQQLGDLLRIAGFCHRGGRRRHDLRIRPPDFFHDSCRHGETWIRRRPDFERDDEFAKTRPGPKIRLPPNQSSRTRVNRPSASRRRSYRRAHGFQERRHPSQPLPQCFRHVHASLASWRYQSRIATSSIKPLSCPTLIKRLKLADLSGRQATLLRNGEN